MSKLNRLLLLLKYTANVQDDPGPTVLSGLNIHPAEMQDNRSRQKEIKKKNTIHVPRKRTRLHKRVYLISVEFLFLCWGFFLLYILMSSLNKHIPKERLDMIFSSIFF